MPAACPMSAYYSPSQSAPSISQDDYSSSTSLRSFDQHSNSPNQVKLVQDDQRRNLSQGTSLSRCSISSDQKSHESHGQATPRSDIGSTNPNTTLYNKLGGPDALEAAVDMFYDKVLADDRLKHFFDGTNMMRLVVKQVLYIATHPQSYPTVACFLDICHDEETCCCTAVRQSSHVDLKQFLSFPCH